MNPALDAGGRLTRTLPGRFYHDPAIWQLEQERLLARLWVCVGRDDQFPAAGHYRTVQVGEESVLVVRGEDQALRAFLNVCRHRGAQLCSAAQGQARTLQCRYHAWTYRLDGRLLRAPGLQDSAEFDRGAFGLVPVALDTWEGLVWLNLAENPPPLTEQLLPQLQPGKPQRLTLAREQEGDARGSLRMPPVLDRGQRLLDERKLARIGG